MLRVNTEDEGSTRITRISCEAQIPADSASLSGLSLTDPCGEATGSFGGFKFAKTTTSGQKTCVQSCSWRDGDVQAGNECVKECDSGLFEFSNSPLAATCRA